MRTALPEESQWTSGRRACPSLQHELKASLQSANTDTLLHYGLSPPALDRQTTKTPKTQKKLSTTVRGRLQYIIIIIKRCPK